MTFGRLRQNCVYPSCLNMIQSSRLVVFDTSLRILNCMGGGSLPLLEKHLNQLLGSLRNKISLPAPNDVTNELNGLRSGLLEVHGNVSIAFHWRWSNMPAALAVPMAITDVRICRRGRKYEHGLLSTWWYNCIHTGHYTSTFPFLFSTALAWRGRAWSSMNTGRMESV